MVSVRRRTALLALAAPAWRALAAGVRLQRLIVGLPAGGALDAQARVLAQALGELQGATVVVDNRAGASMTLAAQELLRAPAEGSTWMYAPSSVFVHAPHTLGVRYDPLRDFTPLALVARGPLVLTAHHALPVTNARELVAWARAHPGALNFANFGPGTNSHLYAAALALRAGLDVVHVPYKGTAEATRDLLEGRVHAYFDAAPTAMRNAATGRVRLLAVAAPARASVLPDVPTLSEQGVAGLDLASWTALVAPPGMEAEAARACAELASAALRTSTVAGFFAQGGYDIVAEGPAALRTEIRDGLASWGVLLRELGLLAPR